MVPSPTGKCSSARPWLSCTWRAYSRGPRAAMVSASGQPLRWACPTSSKATASGTSVKRATNSSRSKRENSPTPMFSTARRTPRPAASSARIRSAESTRSRAAARSKRGAAVSWVWTTTNSAPPAAATCTTCRKTSTDQRARSGKGEARLSSQKGAWTLRGPSHRSRQAANRRRASSGFDQREPSAKISRPPDQDRVDR